MNADLNNNVGSSKHAAGKTGIVSEEECDQLCGLFKQLNTKIKGVMEDEDMAKLTDESVVDLQFDVDGSVDEEWFHKTLGEWATYESIPDVREEMVDDILEHAEGDDEVEEDENGNDGDVIMKEIVSWVEAQRGFEIVKAYLVQIGMDRAVGDIENIEMEMVVKKAQRSQQQTHMSDFFKLKPKKK